MAHASILDIEQKDYEYLQSLCRCRTIQAQIVDRAKILIYKAQGELNAAIAERISYAITIPPTSPRRHKTILSHVQRTGLFLYLRPRMDLG